MKQNADHYKQVQALADDMGIRYEVDATITPMMDGDRSILDLNMDASRLAGVLQDASLLGDQAEQMLSPPSGPTPMEEAYETLPCSAGHTACYVSPYGDVYPCVQFPFQGGQRPRAAFHRYLARLATTQRGACDPRVRPERVLVLCAWQQLQPCQGLAYLEGDMRGPSIQDCEKSYARTGVMSWNLQKEEAGDSIDGRHRLKFAQPPGYRAANTCGNFCRVGQDGLPIAIGGSPPRHATDLNQGDRRAPARRVQHEPRPRRIDPRLASRPPLLTTAPHRLLFSSAHSMSCWR